MRLWETGWVLECDDVPQERFAQRGHLTIARAFAPEVVYGGIDGFDALSAHAPGQNTVADAADTTSSIELRVRYL